MASSLPARDVTIPDVPSLRRLSYAHPVRRFVAFVIDVLMEFAIVIPLAFVINLVLQAASDAAGQVIGPRTQSEADLAGRLLGVLVSWLYHASLESSPLQATIGKRAMGQVVTDLQGRRISFLRATGRHFGKFVSGLLCGLGYFNILHSPKGQGWHDQLAGCLILEGKPGGAPTAEWRAEERARVERAETRPASEGITAPRDQVQE